MLGVAVVSAFLQGNFRIFALVGLGLILAAGYGVIAWRRFRYAVTDGELIVERGVLQHQRRVVPLDRIRGFDQSASIVHRMLGLVEVRIDAAAAGGEQSELALAAITESDADRLRAVVLDRHRPVDGPAPATGEPAARAIEPTLAEVTTARLAIGGATSARWLLAPLAIVGAFLNVAGDLRVRLDELARENADGLGAIGVAGIGAIVLAILVGAVIFAALGSILVDGGFTLRRGADRLTATRGLLSRRSVSISPDRISALEFRDTPAWRALGQMSLRALVTGVGAGSGDARGRTTLLPVAVRREAWRVLRELDPRAHERLDPHPPAARTRRLARACVLPLAGLVASAAFEEWVLAGVALVATGVMALVGIDRYRSLGHRVSPGRLVLRSGSLGRQQTFIRSRAIVDYRLTASPFQRRVGLCTLTAGLGRGAGARSAVDLGWDQAVTVLAALDRPLIQPLLGRRDVEPSDGIDPGAERRNS